MPDWRSKKWHEPRTTRESSQQNVWCLNYLNFNTINLSTYIETNNMPTKCVEFWVITSKNCHLKKPCNLGPKPKRPTADGLDWDLGMASFDESENAGWNGATTTFSRTLQEPVVGRLCKFVIEGIVVSFLLHQEWAFTLQCDTGVISVGQILCPHHFCPWKNLWNKETFHLSFSTSIYFLFLVLHGAFPMILSYIGWFFNKIY